MNYYFYIVEGARGRPGFGITKDIKERAKQYSSHMGEVANFPCVFTGNPRHIRALEKSFKRDSDLIWQVEGWNTEWINDLSIEDFVNLVDEQISDYRYQLEVVAKNYNHTQDI